MGREFSKMEDEFELSLELSIGGRYGKSENSKNIEGKTGDFSDENLSRSDFSSGIIDVGAENGSEFVDLQKKREVQALRRQEARMKREVKKSRGLNNGVFVEDKLVLEAQQFQSRVEDRENREKNGISDDFALKKEENGRKRVAGDLNISLFTENKNLAMQNKFLFPQVQYLPMRNGFAYPWVVPLWGPNVVEGERNEKSAFRPVAKRNGNGSGNSSIDCENREEERSSSVVSDNRSASQKGGSSSDTGSHSSSLVTHQNQHVSRNDEIEHIEVDRASSETEPSKCAGKLNPEQSTKVDSSSFRQLKTSTNKTTERSKSDSQSNQFSSTAEKPSSPLTKETSGLINKPPKPPIQNQNCTSLQHMPCVSTTGNGPNGKTVKGFLYKYTKSEVSIVCVCHGSSFSPAEFVEHAGGVDVSHPLKHITVVSSEFGL